MTASVTGSAPTLLIVEVDNFVYPISKLNNWPATGGTQISIDSGGTQKGTATNAKITNVNSGSITSITINHDATKPNVGDTDATLFFSINAPHSLPADGTIDITFPVQPVTGNDVVVSPTCTQSGGTMSTSMTCSYSSTTNIVTISSPLTTARSGEFNFTISGITNPISTAAVSGIDVKTKASDGGNIDTGTQSWSVPNPLTITGATWSLSDTNKVSAYSTHAISFTLNVPAEAQPQIEFIFPTDVPIDNTILGSYIGGTLFKSGSSFITNTETHVRIVGSDSSNSAGGIIEGIKY